MGTGHFFTSRGAKASVAVVILRGDDGSGLPGGLRHQLLVQRFYGMHIDHSGRYALFLQHPGRPHRFLNHQPRGDQRHVAAVLQRYPSADLKPVIRIGICNVLHRDPPGPQIAGALVIHQSSDRLPGFIGVAGADHRHAGHRAHQAQILDALVGASVLARGETAVASHNRHIQARIGHAVANLIVGPSGREHGEGVAEHLLARRSQTGRDPHHIGLRDPDVVKPLRVELLESAGHGAAGQVRVQNHNRFTAAELSQRFAVSRSRGNHLSHHDSSNSLIF